MNKLILTSVGIAFILKLNAQDINFSSEYNKITWPVALNFGGGITGDDGSYKRLALYHGGSISLQTGSNSPGIANSRLFINSIGQVGIGTTNPQVNLQLDGGSGMQHRLRIASPFVGAEARFDITMGTGSDDLAAGMRGYVPLGQPGVDRVFLGFYNTTYQNGTQSRIERMTISDVGNVGIGTTLPISELQINSGAPKLSLGRVPSQYSQALGWANQFVGFNLARNSQGWLANGDGAHNGGAILLGDPFGQFRIANIPSSGAGDQTLTENQINQNTKFLISSSGNVGIGLGTSDPRSPLEVRVWGDNNSVQTGLTIQQVNTGSPNNKAGVSVDFGIGNNSGNNNIEGRITLKETYWGTQPKMFFSLWDENNSFKDRMVIDTYGNVGIGNNSPDAKLTVTGQVHAQEVKVTVNAPGPDYVFEKDYKLTSLEEIKNYIDQNKHLPEVPSAKEMEKNGVQLGEMNMLLLKKIEELTLYVIELKKENQVQQDQSKTLKAVVELQQKQIEELKLTITKK